jgi:phosphoglycolate phosphatase-like HAD superfamily hydrolase
MLVRKKLQILLREMELYPEWPRPFEGVKEFFAKTARQNIPTATLSAGHEHFIRRSYKNWNAPTMPVVMLTDDDLRPLRRKDGTYPQKPDSELFDLLLESWGKSDPRIEHIPRQNMLYIGDDPKRDGELAENAGVRFAWFNRDERQAKLPSGTITFKYWRKLERQLLVSSW